MNSWHLNTPDSPSRYKLGCYKQNLVVDAPRRNNLILKWDSQRKPGLISETRPRVAASTVTQLVNDYADCRPGPTTNPHQQAQELKKDGRDKFIRSSLGSAATKSSVHKNP